MNRLALPIALFALAAPALAQKLTFVSAERSYFLATAGFGHDFDDYTWTNPTTYDTQEAWVQDATMVLHDYSGHEVSTAHVVHDSLLAPDGIQVSLAADASAPPAMHSSVDATGQSRAKATFDLGARARYSMSVNMVTSPLEYSVAYSSLQGPSGTLFAKQVFQGGTHALSQGGWLQVGTYQFDTEVDASAQANYGETASTATTLDFNFQVLHPGDFELDDDVDHRDRTLFNQAYMSSHASADVDGNGLVEFEDWRLFQRAWFNGFFQGIGL